MTIHICYVRSIIITNRQAHPIFDQCIERGKRYSTISRLVNKPSLMNCCDYTTIKITGYPSPILRSFVYDFSPRRTTIHWFMHASCAATCAYRGKSDFCYGWRCDTVPLLKLKDIKFRYLLVWWRCTMLGYIVQYNRTKSGLSSAPINMEYLLENYRAIVTALNMNIIRHPFS